MSYSVTDIALLEGIRDSDEDAFRILFERYQPTLFRQVLYRTNQTDLARDIVQETFIRIWERRTSLNPQLSILAYLLRISGNLVRDNAKHRRTMERLQSAISSPALSEGDDPAEALHLHVLQEKLFVIINRDLPDRCREVFLLNRFERQTYQEIAASLGISVRTVENQIGRALRILRKSLGR